MRLRGAHIKRHDEAVRTVFRALRHASIIDSAYCVVDAGVAAREMRGVYANRPPAWAVLPTIPEATLERMRPDILVLHNRDSQGAEVHPNEPKRAQIFEIGYCSDLSHGERAAMKHAQHEELASALRAAGWMVQATCVVTIGRCGTIPTATEQALTTAGVPRPVLNTCLTDLHLQAVVAVSDIESLRRTLVGPREPP
jgi:hypothetical protein